jgi:predicted N-formylglutamate amidohydrolase
MEPTALLEPDEAEPVAVHRRDGRSPFLFTCDHGGRLMPRALGDLGLPAAELGRHIAWDIGIAGVGRRLSAALDATLVRQIYSRLVADCNRPPEAPDFAAELSETTAILGNRGLDATALAARRREIWQPYQDRIESLLAERRAAGRPTVLVALHSFTPIYKNIRRPWHIGLLYNRDRRLADAIRPLLAKATAPISGEALVIGDNEPYRLSDATDYTIPAHGERNGLLSLEIEIRQDLIASAEGQAAWAALLARLLPAAANADSLPPRERSSQ